MANATRKLSWTSLIAGILPPFGLAILWQYYDKAYPEEATAGYLEQAENAFLHFKGAGIFSGFQFLYQNRDWRGFLVPSLGFPALLLTDGKVQLAHSLTSLGCFLPLLIYVFLILREYLSDWRAALGTVLIGCIPWVQQAGHDFNSEMPMVTCIAAICFHGLRFQKLDSMKNGLALGAGWGWAPDSARGNVPGFCAPAVNLVGPIVWSGKLRLRDLIAPPIQFSIFVYYIWEQKTPITAWEWAFYGPALFVLLFRRRLGLNRIFAWTFQIFYLSIAFWFLPASSNLYNWLYGSSFGPLAQTTGALLGAVTPAQFLLTVLHLIGGWPLLGLAVVGLIFLGLETPRINAVSKTYIPWMILPALALGAMSPNNDPRYYIDVGLILWLFVAAILLNSSRVIVRVRLVGVVSVCVLFSWVAVVTLFDPDLKTVPKTVARSVFPDYFRKF